jgi:hypothetical protein
MRARAVGTDCAVEEGKVGALESRGKIFEHASILATGLELSGEWAAPQRGPSDRAGKPAHSIRCAIRRVPHARRPLSPPGRCG